MNPGTGLFTLAVFIGAWLLFAVQAMLAKEILPWFGGSAAVWTVCLLFFQTVLWLGYVYAHVVARCLRPRAQMVIHVGLLSVSLLALPVRPGAHGACQRF